MGSERGRSERWRAKTREMRVGDLGRQAKAREMLLGLWVSGEEPLARLNASD